MPTISQLPDAALVTPVDRVPLSQSGVTHSVSVGTLLAGAQPAILTDTGTLLGRTSLGPGGPEPIAIGLGLLLDNGILSAIGHDRTVYPLQPDLVASDQVVLNSGGEPKLLNVSLLRHLFSPGSNIAISDDGTISATISSTADFGSIDHLPRGTAPAAQDLIAINQGGTDYAITYARLIDGETIDMAEPAGPAQDSDQFWLSQGTGTLLRQNLSALWAWIEGKLPGYKRPSLEVSVDTSLDTTVHNGRVLICSHPITLQVVAQNMGAGFSCDIINLSNGGVVFDGPVITSSGSSVIPVGQMAALQCAGYSGGVAVYASISGGGGALIQPAVVSGVLVAASTSSTVSLTWVPVAGAASYIVEYRVKGVADWNVLVVNALKSECIVGSLTPNTTYEFAVLGVNAAGTGPASAVITATTAISLTSPGQISDLAAGDITVDSLRLTWSAPTSGGLVDSYLVQYRTSGTSGWTDAPPVLGATGYLLSGLISGSSYEFQVSAKNAAGMGPVSAILGVTTPQAPGNVSSVAWNLAPASNYQIGTGAVAVNVHVTPGTASVQFGLSRSTFELPASWTAGNHVNTDLWGAYLSTPSSAGTWFVWVSGTDGSCPTVYASGFTVS